jgi:hypothetical protein
LEADGVGGNIFTLETVPSRDSRDHAAVLVLEREGTAIHLVARMVDLVGSNPGNPLAILLLVGGFGLGTHWNAVLALLEDGLLDMGAYPGDPYILRVQLGQLVAPPIVQGVFDDALPCAVIGVRVLDPPSLP